MRDWVVDLTLFLVSIVGGLALFAYEHRVARPPLSPLTGGLGVGVGLAVWLALWWRRRWPVALAVVAIVPATLSAFGSVAVAVLVFSLAVRRRAGVVLPVALAH